MKQFIEDLKLVSILATVLIAVYLPIALIIH